MYAFPGVLPSSPRDTQGEGEEGLPAKHAKTFLSLRVSRAILKLKTQNPKLKTFPSLPSPPLWILCLSCFTKTPMSRERIWQKC